jgi:hypothetical protein
VSYRKYAEPLYGYSIGVSSQAGSVSVLLSSGQQTQSLTNR